MGELSYLELIYLASRAERMGACFLSLAIFATFYFSDFLKLKNFEGKDLSIHTSRREMRDRPPCLLIQSIETARAMCDQCVTKKCPEPPFCD
jgi:hypothetical protein